MVCGYHDRELYPPVISTRGGHQCTTAVLLKLKVNVNVKNEWYKMFVDNNLKLKTLNILNGYIYGYIYIYEWN